MTALFPQPDATPATPPVNTLPALTNGQKVRIATRERPEPTGMVFDLRGMGDTTDPETRVPVLLDHLTRGQDGIIVRIARKHLAGIVEAQAQL